MAFCKWFKALYKMRNNVNPEAYPLGGNGGKQIPSRIHKQLEMFRDKVGYVKPPKKRNPISFDTTFEKSVGDYENEEKEYLTLTSEDTAIIKLVRLTRLALTEGRMKVDENGNIVPVETKNENGNVEPKILEIPA